MAKDKPTQQKKRVAQQRILAQCPHCGSKKIEQLYVKHVGCMRICKDCNEEF